MAKTNDSCVAYDLVVIGAGSAGFSASIRAAELGAKVLLIGEGSIGGTCVNIGCVPSKTLIRAAETLHHAKAPSRFHGIRSNAEMVDWSAIMAEKNKLVSDLRKAKYTDVLSCYDTLTYIQGKAQIAEGGVRIADRLIPVNKVIIATGSSPEVPQINGIERVPYLTSQSALELDHLPASMMIIGGGVIGCELGQMFARMGTEVAIFCRSRLLPKEEPEVSDALKLAFEAEGIRVEEGVRYKSIAAEGKVTLNYSIDEQSDELSTEQLLIATGRLPNTSGLALEEAGINLSPHGGIQIDEYMQTSRPGIYAAGDVTGKDMFVYMAAYGAKIAAGNALRFKQSSYDNSAMSRITFTDPQVASVGMAEVQATASGYDVITSVVGLERLPRALAARDTRGLIKLVANRHDHRLLGAHIIAPEGADSIQTAAIAIKTGMSTEQLGEMVFPYLTTVEGLKLAAQTFDKDVSKLSCCAG